MGFVWKAGYLRMAFFIGTIMMWFTVPWTFGVWETILSSPAFPDNIHQLNTSKWNSHPLRDPTALESSSSRQISEPKVAIFLDYFHHQPLINHSSFPWGRPVVLHVRLDGSNAMIMAIRRDHVGHATETILRVQSWSIGRGRFVGHLHWI